MDDYFKTEDLIEEIKQRTPLWDTTDEGYKRLDVRYRMWNEIGGVFFSDFEELSATEQQNKVKELQRRWKTLRDCYSRALRSERKNQGKKPRKEYVYARFLTFLNPDITIADTDSGENLKVENDEENDKSRKLPKRTRVRPIATYDRLRRKNNTSNLKSEIPVRVELDPSNSNLQNQTIYRVVEESSLEQDGDDMHFFRSLMPIMKIMPLRQKIMFRMEVLKKAMEYSEEISTVSETSTS